MIALLDKSFSSPYLLYKRITLPSTYGMFHLIWAISTRIGTNWERFQRMSCDNSSLPFLCAHLSEYRVHKFNAIKDSI